MTDEQRIQHARVKIFGKSSDLFEAGRFSDFDRMLRQINVYGCPIELLLTITRCARFAADELTEAVVFYDKVRRRFESELGRVRAAALLDNLNPLLIA